MPTWITRFVASPVFEGDEEKTRVASLLNTLIFSVLASAMFSNIAAPVVYSRPTVGWLIAGIVMLLCLGELFLMHRGHVHTASLLFLSGLWAFFTLLIYVSGGTTSVFSIGYVTVTITAGLLLGGYVAITVAGVSILASLWILYVEGSGSLPAPILPVNMGSGWLNLTANLLAAAAVLYLATRSIDNALKRARSSERAQIEANRQLRATRDSLEAQVADRTSDLAARSAELEEANLRLEATLLTSQRRATLLEAISQVSRTVAQIRDLDQLLPRVTQLISQHFSFYHVGIFLIDAAGRHAVLRAANSQGGQRMLARTHRLAVGSQGIVGYVTGTGEPRIALDVDTDAVFFDNPDLPDTRSEMAAPLRVGDEIIGALDVQSTQEVAFDQEDVALLTILADQIAIAIDNARLFHQTQEALEETQRAHRSYLQQQWSRFIQEQPPLSYEYTLSGLPSSEDTPSRAALAVPIVVRDETIGVLDLQDVDDEHIWTEDEIAIVQTIADQLGQALESARLFEQTQASLAETQTLFQTSHSLAAAQRMEEIWKAVIDAAGQRGVDACGLLLFDTTEPETTSELVLVAAWDHKHDPPRLPIGSRLPLSDLGLFDTQRTNRQFSITDLAQADGINDATYELLKTLGFSALLYQPIAVREQLFGLLAVLFELPHAFTQAETDFYAALADQTALALESHRLLVETQRRAEREQLIRQITDKVRATSDLEKILQTTVQEVSKAMGLPRAFIRLGTEQGLTSTASSPRSESNDKDRKASTTSEEPKE